MKKLLFILSFLISANSFAQNNLIWGKRVQATENLQLRTKTVTEISEDSTDVSRSASKLMTEQAIKAYIRRYGVGGNIASGRDSGYLIYDGLLDFHTTLFKYHINNVYYTALPDTFSLEPAHELYARKDYIYLDIYGNVGVLTGTPGVSAVPPDYDPATQLIIAEALVKANATTPDNFRNRYIYRSNIEEFIGTSNISGALFDTTLNAFSAPVATYFPAFSTGQYIEFKDPENVYSRGDGTILRLRIRKAAVWSNSTYMSIKFVNETTSVSSYVNITNNTHGFNRNTNNEWLEIFVELPEFRFTSDAYTGLYINMAGSNASPFQLDDIIVQDGGATSSPSDLVTSVQGKIGSVWLIASDLPYYITSAWFEGRNFKYTIGRDTFTRALPSDTTKFDTECFRMAEKVTTLGPHDTLYFKFSCLDSILALKENSLGNPDVDGKVLSSTAAGVRSWITMSPGGGGGGGNADSLGGLPASEYKLKSDSTAASGYATQYDLSLITPGGTTSDQYQTYSGSSVFTFTSVPATPSDYSIVRNGMYRLKFGVDFTVSGNNITVLLPLFTTPIADEISFHRIK